MVVGSFVTFSALAHGASSVGLAVGVGSARVVMARVQGAARKNILELASLLRSDTSKTRLPFILQYRSKE